MTILCCILIYIFLIPGAYTLMCVIDKTFGDKTKKGYWFISIFPPMIFLAIIVFIIVAILVSPFVALANGREGLYSMIYEDY